MTPQIDLCALVRHPMERLALAGRRDPSPRDGLIELAETLASRLNGCTVCTRMHERAALAAGETQERLDALVHWQSSPVFSDRERIALAWAEALTRKHHVRIEALRPVLLSHFEPRDAAELTLAIGLINAWNVLTIAAHGRPAEMAA